MIDPRLFYDLVETGAVQNVAAVGVEAKDLALLRIPCGIARRRWLETESVAGNCLSRRAMPVPAGEPIGI